MLSSLSKLADRSFILGFFLPTLLFAVILLGLFRDQPLVKECIPAVAERTLGPVYLLLPLWAVAAVLLMLNDWLYRFLEGNAFPFPGWLAERLKSRKRQHLRRDSGEIKKLFSELEELSRKLTILHSTLQITSTEAECNKYTAEYEMYKAELAKYADRKRTLLRRMPLQETEVLATDFGNAIKAFEVYPDEIYGAGGVVIWPRLASVMPTEFGEQIEGIRSQIDFWINCCLFSAIVGVLGLVRTIWSGNWHEVAFLLSSYEWLSWTVLSPVVSYVFYRLAVTLVPAWGELVKSAFDCYLPALAGQLGFVLPIDETDRLTFWRTFSQQLMYRRQPDGTTPFLVKRWKQMQPKTVYVEMERNTESQNGKAGERGDTDDSEES